MRFNEYNDSWQKCSLKSFTKRVTRKNVGQVSKRPLTISAQYGLIDQSEFFDRQIASKDMSGYYLLKNGEFAYNKSYSNDYPWGAVKRLDKYECGALSTLYICFSLDNSIVSSDFLSHYFETNKWHKGVSDIAGEGARNHGLLNMSVEDYFLTKHYLPSLREQEKISYFFNLITTRIETQSKIIEDLELYKNTIANQLIYNNPLLDKTVPLKEYATLKNGYAFKSDTYSETGNYKVVTIANVTGNKYISTTDCNSIETLPIDIQSHQILKFGDILVSLTGNVGRVSIVNEVNCLLNQRVGVLFFKNIQLKKYLFQVLSNKLFETKMVQKGQGVAQKNIGNEDVESFLIPISNNLEYINKITKVLDALDEKIAIEKQILEKLKEQKKFLLSNMFI